MAAADTLVARALDGDDGSTWHEGATTKDRIEMNLWLLRTLAAFARGGGALPCAAAPRVAPAKTARFVQVVYVVGVEGVGHHGLTPVLGYAFVRRYGWRDTYLWWRGLRDVFLPDSVVSDGASLYKSPCDATETPAARLARRRAAVAALLAPLAARGRPCVVFEFASFPWGTAEGRAGASTRFANAAADRDEPHPGDSANLDDWHAAFATLDFVEAKYLVLRRDPVRAAWSHREWDGSFGRHAESNAALARYVCDFLREPRLCDAPCAHQICNMTSM